MLCRALANAEDDAAELFDDAREAVWLGVVGKTYPAFGREDDKLLVARHDGAARFSGGDRVTRANLGTPRHDGLQPVAEDRHRSAAFADTPLRALRHGDVACARKQQGQRRLYRPFQHCDRPDCVPEDLVSGEP